MNEFDQIEREIEIAASARKVWELIAEPGWYINDGALTEHRIEKRGEVTLVNDPVHGEFAFATVALDEPHYAAFRWLQNPDDPQSASTLVEFRIREKGPDAVTLSVVESGFASLPGTATERRSRFDDNVEGWELELAMAKSNLESV